jgi:hypothetical protein
MKGQKTKGNDLGTEQIIRETIGAEEEGRIRKLGEMRGQRKRAQRGQRERAQQGHREMAHEQDRDTGQEAETQLCGTEEWCMP